MTELNSRDLKSLKTECYFFIYKNQEIDNEEINFTSTVAFF
jgi:hypothetical protein